MRKTVQVLSLLWSVTLVLGQRQENPFPLDPLAQLVQNVTNITTATYKSSQLYSLVFTLDGRSGDGLLDEVSQVREFTGYMINLTSTFAPEFVSPEAVLNVATRCRYRRQNSYDGDIMQWITPRAKQMEPDDDEPDDAEIEQILKKANTTYQYEFSMNYSSDVVNVENFTKYFENRIVQSKLSLARKLRNILGVEEDKILTVHGIFVSWDAILNSVGGGVGNATLPPGSVFINVTIGGNSTGIQTLAPTISSQPSSLPSISSAPTVTPMPTNVPSVMPTNYPTTSPSVSPTMFPTFFVNSTSRGRYELTFTVTGNRNPATMFVNQTQFCNTMIGFNRYIKGEDHSIDQILTTCPIISGIYTTSPDPSTPPAATVPPDSPSQGRDDFNNTSNDTLAPTMYPTEGTTFEDTDDTGRMLLRRRFLQDIAVESNGTVAPTRPNATVLWRYSIVMRYTSAYWNVSQYPRSLELFINTEAGKQMIADELEIKYNLTDSNITVESFLLFNDVTDSPSAVPTELPSENPTIQLSWEPTRYPTMEPTVSYAPTISPRPTLFNGSIPVMPTVGNATLPPSANNTKPPTTPDIPTDSGTGNKTVIIVVVVVILIACAIMAGMFFFYKRRKKELDAYKSTVDQRGSQMGDSVDGRPAAEEQGVVRNSTDPTASPSVDSPRHERGFSNASSMEGSAGSSKYISVPHHTKDMSLESVGMGSVTSSSNPQSSQPSSAGQGRFKLSDIAEDPQSPDLAGGAEEDEEEDDEDYDDDHQSSASRRRSGPPPLDPFDQYHDQNLEKMRSEVEENVAGLDGMMSQAMTKALMDSTTPSPKDTSPWHGAKSGVEIEVIVLWEVSEWIRRHSGVEYERKQDYMQQMLNKMVTSVRKGFVDPEVASRSIHECAYLLGLELANQLPSGTIILSGMQKTTTTQDVIRTFKKFGPVDDAAVAPKRGFGLVRFRNQKHTDAALFQHQTSEVVVKDVAITMKLL